MEKIVRKESTEKTIVEFKAIDGTLFDDEQECRTYEKSASCVIRSRIKIHNTNAWNLCFGSEDDAVEIISGKEDDIKMYIFYIQPRIYNKENVEKIIESKIEENEKIIIFYNYEGTIYNIISEKDFRKRIENEINYEKQEN